MRMIPVHKTGQDHRQRLLIGMALLVIIVQRPSSALDITPKDIASFATACHGLNVTPAPRQVEGNLVFDAAANGGGQLDPQVAVGGGMVVNASNKGVALFSKSGDFIGGGSPSCLNLDFDPKAFFEPIGKRLIVASMSFAGSARISIAKANDPNGGWWAYTIPVPGWQDGGAVGGNKKWITYSYPSTGGQAVFLMDRVQAESGATVTVVDLGIMPDPGQPVFTFDTDQVNLYYVKLSGSSIKVNYVNPAGQMNTQPSVNHGLGLSYPNPFPQKGGATTSAGDINAKMAVLRNGSIWTCDAAATSAGGTSRTTVRFYQVDLTGKIIQTAAIDDPTGAVYSGQATLAVNKRNDVLLVFQQSGKDMYISSRMSYRLGTDPPGTLRPVAKQAEGQGANSAAAWGDYSGASIDGDNDLDLWGINSVASPTGGGNSVIFRLGLSDGTAIHPAQTKTLDCPGLSIHLTEGWLVLTGPGLSEKSRVEILTPNGATLVSTRFTVVGNGTGKIDLSEVKPFSGPVFVRLRKDGFQDSRP